jgi:hypothetical protein
VGEVGDVGLEVMSWLPSVKVERRGCSWDSNSASEVTTGSDSGGVLDLLSGSGEEAESQSFGSRARDGEGGGG